MTLDPIIVVGPYRSGTSLITGLIHLGGAWCGLTQRGNFRNPLGYFENKKLMELIGTCREDAISTSDIKEMILKEIESQGYRGGPWVVKMFSPYCFAWRGFHPFWIFCNRDIKNIIQSRYRGKDVELTQKDKNRVIDYVSDFRFTVDRIRTKTNNYAWIQPDKLIEGDYSELKYIYQKTGLIFYPDLVNHFIIREHWHYPGGTAKYEGANRKG